MPELPSSLTDINWTNMAIYGSIAAVVVTVGLLWIRYWHRTGTFIPASVKKLKGKKLSRKAKTNLTVAMIVALIGLCFVPPITALLKELINQAITWFTNIDWIMVVKEFLKLLLVTTVVLPLLHRIMKKRILPWLRNWIKGNRWEFDDVLLEHNTIKWFTTLFVWYITSLFIPWVFSWSASIESLAARAVSIYIVYIVIQLANSILKSATDLYKKRMPKKEQMTSPARIFLEAGSWLTWILGIAYMIAVFRQIPVWQVFSLLSGGALIFMYVFQDTVKNFFGGIIISRENLLKIGDWVTLDDKMDGDVLDKTILVVKLKLFDGTLMTIPNYVFITKPFINWSYMFAKGGRRIKKKLIIDVQTIRSLTKKEIKYLKTIDILKPYIESKLKAVAAHNKTLGISADDPINGRVLTNLGTFRAFIELYLKSLGKIDDEGEETHLGKIHTREGFTFLIRELEQTTEGQPIQIYVFTTDTKWAVHEGVQSDILEYLMRRDFLECFGLRLFQKISGNDIRETVEALSKQLTSGNQPKQQNNHEG